MSDQNRDPFAEAFGPLYERGALIDVPISAAQNHSDREAKRAALVKDRVPAQRSREEVLAALRVERDRAAAFVAQADRKLVPGGTPLSSQVDAILADEGTEFGVDEDEEVWDGTA